MLAVTCTSACGTSPSARLDAAERLSASRPDSAYAILRDIDYNDLDADSLKARYILTRALTNVRVGRSSSQTLCSKTQPIISSRRATRPGG